MNPVKLIYVVLIAFASCRTERNYDLMIKIESAQSYSYDLKRRLLTVHNILKPDTTIQFALTDQELKSIIDKYYELNLNKLKSNYQVGDSCMSSPKLFTTLEVNSQKFSQQIMIDNSCHQFIPSDSTNGNRIVAFIKYTFSILKSKPQIKNAPNSEMFYY